MPTGTKVGSQRTGIFHVYIGQSGKVIAPRLPASLTTYRTIRKHPTIALARRLATAPILRASWGVEGEADDVTMAIAKQVTTSLRSAYIRHALYNLYDYGYVGFEQYLTDNEQLVLKPLLADYTQVRIDDMGEFAGIQVGAALGVSGAGVQLEPEECVFIGMEAEAGSFYGEGMLEVARLSFNEWTTTNEGASRYDSKVAGTRLQLHFPSGKSTIGGVEKDNYDIAQDALAAFESSGTVAFEEGGPDAIENLEKALPPRWRIEYVSDSSPRQASFIERMKYLDSLMVRAFGFPERAILEGEFGTKAEAGVHQGLALEGMEAMHEFLTEEFEIQVLKPHLILVTGSDEGVKLTPGPVSKENKLWKRKLFMSLVKEAANVVDFETLQDEVGVPRKAGVPRKKPIIRQGV